jgi:hypothetical protein
MDGQGSIPSRSLFLFSTEGKVKSILIIFFDIKGIVTRNSSWQATQSILRTIMTFYGDCAKTCEDFILNFGDKRTGCCITTTHRLTLPFATGNFWPKTTWLSSPTNPTFLFFSIEDKTERLPFWHNWGDRGRIAGGAEQSQNTTPRMHSKNGRSALICAYERKRSTLRVMLASSPRVSFWPDGSTSTRYSSMYCDDRII